MLLEPAAVFDFIRTAEKERGIIPDPKLEALSNHIHDAGDGDSIMVDIM